MSNDGNDLLFSSSAPAMSFSVGTEVLGKVEKFGKSHRREVKYDRKNKTYEQGEKLYWQDNATPGTGVTDRPVEDPVLTLFTTFTKGEGTRRGIEGDDGMRRIFAKGRATEGSILDALKDAVREANVRKVLPGDYVRIACTGEGEAYEEGMRRPKLFEAEYFTASNPPEWAAQLGGNTEPLSDDDDPFA